MQKIFKTGAIVWETAVCVCTVAKTATGDQKSCLGSEIRINTAYFLTPKLHETPQFKVKHH